MLSSVLLSQPPTESPHPPWSIFANTHAREPGLSDREWLFGFHDARRAAQPRHLVLAPEREPTASVSVLGDVIGTHDRGSGVASDGFWQDAVPLATSSASLVDKPNMPIESVTPSMTARL